MQNIYLSEIPLFIKKGDLYKSFINFNNENKENNEKKIIINRNMKFDLIITSNNELFLLLDTLLFWQVKDFPTEVYNYIFLNKKNINFNIIYDKYHYINELDEIKELKIIIENSGENLIYKIIQEGYINLLKYLIEVRKDILNDNVCTMCALYGQLEMLIYLYEIHKYPLSFDLYTYSDNTEYSTKISSASYALINGNYDCLKYIYEKGCQIDNELYEYILYSLPKSDNHTKCKKYIESFIK